MTTAATLKTGEAGRPEYRAPDVALRTSLLRSCWTLYLLTLRQHLHGKRWMVVALLFLLPAGLAILMRITAGVHAPSVFREFLLCWILIPQALLPLVALLYASGIIQDEQEEQTITYLLIRPIPKWLLYWVKMVATWSTTVFMVVVLVVLTFAAVHLRSETDVATAALRCAKAAAILSLAAITYCSVFGLMSLLTRRTLIVGILYAVIIEGLLATFPLSLRWGTIIYHTRMIAYRTMDFVVTWPRGREDDVAAAAWMLNIETDPTLSEHPQLSTNILVLVGASVVSTALAAWLCSRREFHVKTPEKE
jgi:ABC-2 type transport system permease protein